MIRLTIVTQPLAWQPLKVRMMLRDLQMLLAQEGAPNAQIHVEDLGGTDTNPPPRTLHLRCRACDTPAWENEHFTPCPNCGQRATVEKFTPPPQPVEPADAAVQLREIVPEPLDAPAQIVPIPLTESEILIHPASFDPPSAPEYSTSVIHSEPPTPEQISADSLATPIFGQPPTAADPLNRGWICSACSNVWYASKRTTCPGCGKYITVGRAVGANRGPSKRKYRRRHKDDFNG